MDATERRAWLHHCGRLVPGADESFCPGCRFEVKPAEVEARYILTPVDPADEDADALRLAAMLLDPAHHQAVAVVVRREARRDPAWFGALLRRELRLVTLRPPTGSASL